MFTNNEQIEKVNKKVRVMNENDIIHIALNALNQEILIEWDWDTVNGANDRGIDGILTIGMNNRQFNFRTEIKNDLKNHQLFTIIHQKETTDDFLLVAGKLYPTIKKELRENNINYIEANGNAYIEREGIYLYINTNKTINAPRDKGNRAFTKTGLKVVFHFLLQPQLINFTQREIADITNVALGNIPQVMNGLLETNFILKLNRKEYIIKDYEQLLNKWIVEYEQTLKPTLFRQRFKLLNQNQDWRDIQLDVDKTVWGGEPAGDIVTNHLRPEKLTLYTTETTNELIKNYKLIPDKDGDIWVYDLFWKETFNTQTAPLQLVYADLMITNDKRCKETANIIFHEHIKPNL